MKNILSKLKKINLKKLSCCTLVVLLFFGFFAKMNYTADTYSVIADNPNEIFHNFIKCGRFLTAISFKVLLVLHVPIKIAYLLSFVIAVISLIATIYLLEELIRKWKVTRNGYLSLLLSIAILINPFSIELFFYIEKGIMVTSLLFDVLGAIYLSKYLDNKKNKSNLLFSFITMCFAACTYQGTMGLFIALATIDIISRKDPIGSFARNTLLSGFLYAIPALLDIVVIKILANDGRINGEIVLLESVKKIIIGAVKMLKMCDIFPYQILLVLLVICASVGIYSASTKNAKVKTAISILWATLVVFIASLAPQIIQSTNSIWIVPRVIYVWASLFPIICSIISFCNKKKKVRYVMTASVLCFLLISYFSFANIITDNYSLNSLDRNKAKEILSEISNYEADSGLEVRAVTFATDQHPLYSYEGIPTFGDMNVSAFYTSWSDISILNYYSGKGYYDGGNEEFKEECEKKDYSESDGLQLSFKNNEALICLF